ncbi:MAG TPA: SRPBCC family protein [Anaeromyxobacteraceae bacterium]|nr:SRPBCC family protein [Anaeromyxobacteraceae bacterium]
MKQTISEISVAIPPEQFFDIIVDYARYPEFVPSLRACRPGARKGDVVEVEFELDLGIKTIRYSLRHMEERPRRVYWSLVKSDWMQVSNGSWELIPEQGGTRARYTVEIQVAKPTLIPQALVDRVTTELTKVQLPRTLQAFKARAERG